jgi:DNA-binding IclR family transcriptional regulator
VGKEALKREQQDSVAAVERALQILAAFREGDSVLSLAELARRTGFHKSTILRLSGSLTAFAFLVRDAEGGFRIGPGLWRAGRLFLADLHLETELRPVLARLADKTEESASFYVPTGGAEPGRMCLLRADSRHSLREHVSVGQLLPLGVGAGGRLLRAYLAPEAGDNEVVAHGHYLSYGERLAEVGGIAAPVFGVDHRIVGALTLSAPTARRSRDWFEAQVPRLIAAAATASHAIAGHPPAVMEG